MTVGGPGLLLVVDDVLIHLGEDDGLHHLADHAVRDDHDGVAVFVGGVESDLHEVDGLLHGGGGEDDETVITVAAALGGLEVVALAGLDGAEAGAAAHDVHDDAGQLGGGYVADALLLEGHAGGGGAGEDARAGAGSAVDHVDGADLALGLQEAAADLRHARGHVLGYLRLRGYRVAEEVAAAGADRGFSYGFAALHKSQCHI